MILRCDLDILPKNISSLLVDIPLATKLSTPQQKELKLQENLNWDYWDRELRKAKLSGRVWSNSLPLGEKTAVLTLSCCCLMEAIEAGNWTMTPGCRFSVTESITGLWSFEYFLIPSYMNLVLLLCSRWLTLLFVVAVVSNRTEHIWTTSVEYVAKHVLAFSSKLHHIFPKFLSALCLEALVWSIFMSSVRWHRRPNGMFYGPTRPPLLVRRYSKLGRNVPKC